QVKLNDMAKKLDSMASMLAKVSESAAVKDEHETLLKLVSLLEQNEFSQSYIDEIKDRVRGEFKLEELDDEHLVMTQVADWIGEDISVAPRFPGKKKPHVIIVVGPTGVGKTTTIAKMAAEIKIMASKNREHKPVIHMITTDNVRVAAKEQIERYAEVMELAVDKVDSKEDLENLLGIYGGARAKGDFVFIDTSGFSPNDYDHISKLQEMLDVRNLKADIYLAVSATTKGRDLEKIFKNYEPFGFRSVIVTKCDETSTYGNVLSVLHEKRKSVSWITVGQEVMHTLKRADPVYFLRNLDGFDVDIGHLERKFGQGESSAADSLGE
ncbi:MAG: flagellar biosynthesis protein FlhF, partial [Treponema sp.]|nr:flagellar biosynthesis protein FlhF [Treponema sp.]